MTTTLAKIKRNYATTEAGLSLIARQWGHAEDTGRLVVMRSDGVTKDFFYNSVSLAKQTSTYGSELIGTGPITGVTPSGGSLGASGTVYAMLQGVYDACVVLQPGTDARNVLQSADDVTGLTIQAFAGQTEPLQAWANSSGTAVATISPTGAIIAPSFTGGSITLASDATIGGDLNLSGALVSTQSGSDASAAIQLTAAQPTVRWKATGQTTNEKEWDTTVSGTSLLFRTRTDALGAGATWLTVTRSGTTVSTVAIGGTAATVAGTLAVTGLLTASGGVSINGGSFAAGSIYSNATDGTVITGSAGSATDLVLQNRAGGAYMTGEPNTQAVTFPGTLSVTGSATANGFITSTADAMLRANNTDQTAISGGNASTAGANITLYGGAHATLANNWLIRHGMTNDIAYDGTNITITPPVTMSANVTLTGGDLDVARSADGATVISRAKNTSNTAGSDAQLGAIVGGSSAGNPYTLYAVSAGAGWTTGMLTSDGSYVVSESYTLGTDNRLKIAAGGAVSIPGTLSVTGLLTATAGVNSASDLVFTGSSGVIRTDTSDGSDDKTLFLTGAGAYLASTGERGGGISLSGNEVASFGGSVQISVGSASTAQILLQIMSNKSGAFIIFDRDSNTMMQIDSDTGTTSLTGSLVVYGDRIRLPGLAGDPSSPQEGDIWYDTSGGHLVVYSSNGRTEIA